MDNETVSAVVETQIPTTAVVEPEVTTPEANAEAQETKPEETEAQRIEKRMQRRIDKRTADFYRVQAENERLARELEQTRQKPTEETQYDPEQIEQVVRTRAQEIARMERINDQCNTVAAKGAKEFEDFSDALKSLAQETGPLFDKRGHPLPLMEVVLEADNPAKLLHHLGTHPDLAAELTDLTPTQLARKLDRIEREMTSQPQKSGAPKPLTPVKGTASNDELHSGLSDEEWIKRREKQLKAQR